MNPDDISPKTLRSRSLSGEIYALISIRRQFVGDKVIELGHKDVPSYLS
jgi:hypothetical protein